MTRVPWAADSAGERVIHSPAVRAVEVEDLVVAYGHVQAVRGVSFAVEPGEVFGLLGPNGAGKTSVLRVLVALKRPSAGRALVLGHAVTAEPRAVRRLIGYVPQALSADGSLTGRENAELSARLYRVPARERRDRVDAVLGLMGLGGAGDDLVHTYSGGMIRRLEIACALVSSPRLLLLDEPTLGLDPGARRSVWEYLQHERAETGMSILVTTHYMEEAQQHCDRVAVMTAGQVLARGTPGELRAGMGPEATLEDVFVAMTGSGLGAELGRGDGGRGGGGGGRPKGGGMRDVTRTRRAAKRLA